MNAAPGGRGARREGPDDAAAGATEPASDRRPGGTGPTLIDAAAVLALAYVVGGTLSVPVRQTFDGPLGDAASLATFGALLVVFAAGWPLLRRGADGLRAVVGPAPTPAQLLAGVAVGLVAGGVLNVMLPPLLEIALERVGLEPPTVQETARQALTDPASRAVATVGVVIMAPLGEELIFRGIAYRALRRHLRVVGAVVASALLFAVLHTTGASWLGAAYLVATLGILAAGLALLVERQRHVWGAMLAHAGFNAVAVLVIWSA